MSNNKQSSVDKEFVPYKQALALKELGFDEPCFGFYLDNGLWVPSSSSNWGEDPLYPTNSDLLSGDVSAPLYQQAFRWFREKYGLAHNIHPITYDCYVVNQKDPSIDDIGDFNTYEEAELACLKKLIEIVKNK